MKSAHADPKVNDKFAIWAEEKYGSEELSYATATRGEKHDCLGATLDFSMNEALKVDVIEYVNQIGKDFLENIKQEKKPWSDKIFKIDKNSEALSKEKSKIFHSFAMKLMFLCKRGRPDVEVGASFLSALARKSTAQDCNKLVRLANFLVSAQEDALCIEIDDSCTMTWHIDASFASHSDMRSHTGSILMLRKGSMISGSSVQKRNARSSAESELNGVDDKISKIS